MSSPRWEYQLIRLEHGDGTGGRYGPEPDQVVARLDQLGDEGWEAVGQAGVTFYGYPNYDIHTVQHRLLMKRRKV